MKHRAKRLVVKVGTNTLTGGEERLSRPQMMGVARQVAKLVREGHQVALVSSGAIVAGREALQIARNGKDIPFKQVLAAVGQAKLMQKWDALFTSEDIIIAQTLLTRGDLAERQGYLNARNTLLALLERDVVPIINEGGRVFATFDSIARRPQGPPVRIQRRRLSFLFLLWELRRRPSPPETRVR